MVNEFGDLGPEEELALSYAPAGARGAMSALLALDRKLGSILRRAREPLLTQMRLTWWFEALERLDREPPPAEPVLRALAADVLPRGVAGAALAAMIDGWEAIGGEEPLGEAALEAFARGRGALLFEAMAAVCGADDAQAGTAGEGWALADLAGNLSDAGAGALARGMAAARLAEGMGSRWSRAGRGIGALALAARMELEGGSAPKRVGRLFWHRMTGR